MGSSTSSLCHVGVYTSRCIPNDTRGELEGAPDEYILPRLRQEALLSAQGDETFQWIDGKSRTPLTETITFKECSFVRQSYPQVSVRMKIGKSILYVDSSVGPLITVKHLKADLLRRGCPVGQLQQEIRDHPWRLPCQDDELLVDGAYYSDKDEVAENSSFWQGAGNNNITACRYSYRTGLYGESVIGIEIKTKENKEWTSLWWGRSGTLALLIVYRISQHNKIPNPGSQKALHLFY